MTTTREPVFVAGVWGPFRSAMVPGFWLNEGGQSVAGAAIDHLIDFHPFAPEARERAAQDDMALPDWLVDRAASAGSPEDVLRLVEGLHVVPEFLGNRAPFADPQTRAVVAGLGMERDLESLIGLHVAGLCGIGYGLRQIMDAQAEAGAPVERIVISGGAGRSPLIRQILADATGKEVAAPQSEEPVLLGAAMLGAIAGGVHPDAATAMGAMSAFSARYRPEGAAVAAVHAERYGVFRDLQSIARRIASR